MIKPDDWKSIGYKKYEKFINDKDLHKIIIDRVYNIYRGGLLFDIYNNEETNFEKVYYLQYKSKNGNIYEIKISKVDDGRWKFNIYIDGMIQFNQIYLENEHVIKLISILGSGIFEASDNHAYFGFGINCIFPINIDISGHNYYIDLEKAYNSIPSRDFIIFIDYYAYCMEKIWYVHDKEHLMPPPEYYALLSKDYLTEYLNRHMEEE